MDWPCQDFNQGSTREQPILHPPKLFPWSSDFQKHDIANWIYATSHARIHIEANALLDVWNIFQEKTISSCIIT